MSLHTILKLFEMVSAIRIVGASTRELRKFLDSLEKESSCQNHPCNLPTLFSTSRPSHVELVHTLYDPRIYDEA